jgi:histidinol dehydrogenase
VKLLRSESRAARALLGRLEFRGAAALDRVEPAVRRIVADVRRGGEKALLAHARRLDGLASPHALRVREEEMESAWHAIPAGLAVALEQAAANIRRFAARQMPAGWALEGASPSGRGQQERRAPRGPAAGAEAEAGLETGQLVRPLDAVGCYVPGGRHPLPSTLLMTAIAAQVAGVGREAVVSPNPAPETLAAAHLAGVTEFYRVGGAQAVAALAYGAGALARVDKIVGPGNLYVTAAKRMVAFDCAIDMLAGPTEILVVSEQGEPEAIAADLVAQAEHDVETLEVFVTTRVRLARAVAALAPRLARENPVARQALAQNGYVLLAPDLAAAREIANRLAAEHLTVDAIEDLAWVRSAGSVFVGPYSPQPMGDYVSGPNHTLPTGGAARARGGLSVFDFVKLITVQQYSAEALARLGPHAARLADAEGLSAHAQAIRSRMAAFRPGRKS